LELPPLRDRGGDVMEIASSFLTAMSAEEGKAFSRFSEQAENLLLTYRWPGNVRELQNVVRNAVILNEGDVVEADMLTITSASGVQQVRAAREAKSDTIDAHDLLINLAQPFAQIEKEIIDAAILRCGDSIPRASEMLDLSPSTIYRKRESWQKNQPSE
jgi:two-component system repressor protein LuxO